jgi:acyl-CoA thioesterase I
MKTSTTDTIVCFGNSLTEGAGVSLQESYPSLLATRIGRPVINAGTAGDMTHDGLRRIARDVLSHRPELVVLEFGANDFLWELPVQETFDNLTTMIRQLQHAGASVVLVEVRMGWWLQDAPDHFERVASETGCALVPHVLGQISTDASLLSDAVHPNAAGYVLMAQRIGDVVEPLLSQEQHNAHG